MWKWLRVFQIQVWRIKLLIWPFFLCTKGLGLRIHKSNIPKKASCPWDPEVRGHHQESYFHDRQVLPVWVEMGGEAECSHEEGCFLLPMKGIFLLRIFQQWLLLHHLVWAGKELAVCVALPLMQQWVHRNTRPGWPSEGGFIIDAGMVELTDLQIMAPSWATFPSNSGPASPSSDHTGTP